MLPEKLQRPSGPEEARLLQTEGFRLAGLRQADGATRCLEAARRRIVSLSHASVSKERVNVGKVLKYTLGEEEDVLAHIPIFPRALDGRGREDFMEALADA